jgi:hypothetical protein
MYARLILIAAMLTSTSAFAADPVKPDAEPTVQPKKATAPVVLASAGDVPAAATANQPAPVQPKRRGRVTTCRCGDPQAQPEPEQQ